MFSYRRCFRWLTAGVLSPVVLVSAVSSASAQVALYGEGYSNFARATMGNDSPGFVGVTPFGVFGPYSGERFGGFRTDGWNGYGVDNTSWGAGYGTNWGIGYLNPYAGAYGESPYSLTLASPDLFRTRSSRYNLMSADAAAAFQAANTYQQQALDGLTRFQRARVIDVKARPAKGGSARAEGGTTALIPPDKLFDAEGHVRWPAAAPKGEDVAASRKAADEAVQAVFREYQKSGKASLHSVVEARNKLALFSSSALDKLRSDSPADAIGFEVFLQSLDTALNGMMGTNVR